MNNLIKGISQQKPFVKYLVYSGIVTVIDSILVWILMTYLNINLVYANTIGVILGFFIHYALASKSIFNANYGWIGFLIYGGTFIIGLFLAGIIIHFCYQELSHFLVEEASFIVSKGASVVIPFFVLYFMRRYLYQLIFKIPKYKGGVAF